MRKIDPGYLYETGASIRPLVRVGEAWGVETAAILTNARDAIYLAIYPENLYAAALKQARALGDNLLAILNRVIARIDDQSNPWDGTLTDQEIRAIIGAYVVFEGAYTTELRNAAIYYIAPHSAFDIEELIQSGWKLFPQSLDHKVPEAMRDVNEGAKALAYQIWTASGYHFHRANEAVLRRYFDHVAGPRKRQPTWTMGTLCKKMRKWGVGKIPIIAAQENIIEFHRNPLAHPEHFIADAEEAVSLYTSIRAAIGYILPELPEPPPVIQTVIAPPGP